jgi:phenylacetate-CoA ligase
MQQDRLAKLNRLLQLSMADNAFYQPRLEAVRDFLPLGSLEDFQRLVPLTEKGAWIEDQKLNPPYGTNLAFPLEAYSRCHQTSGTTGNPMRWLDTPTTWDHMLDAWGRVFRGAGAQNTDRVFLPFLLVLFWAFGLRLSLLKSWGCFVFRVER